MRGSRSNERCTSSAIWPERYDPKTSAIYALNDVDVKAPPEVVWNLLVHHPISTFKLKRGSQWSCGIEVHPSPFFFIPEADNLVRQPIKARDPGGALNEVFLAVCSLLSSNVH